MKKAMTALYNGWSIFLEGRTREEIQAKGMEAPNCGFVSSKVFKPCRPQEALDLLKARAEGSLSNE